MRFPAQEVKKNEFSTEEEQSIMRSELGKLMRLSRIAWPGAVYDASAAAQNFANCKPDVSKEGISDNEIREEEEPINVDVPKPNDFEHMPGFKDSLSENAKEAIKVNLLKKPKKADTSKTHFTAENLSP